MQLSPDGRLPQFQQSRSQSGILRFNCADSLDRTNISNFCKLSFFQFIFLIFSNPKKVLSFQIVGEMLTRLGVPLDLSSSKLSNKIFFSFLFFFKKSFFKLFYSSFSWFMVFIRSKSETSSKVS